jgi:hypothetical protein
VVVDVDRQPPEQLGLTLQDGTHARQVAAVADYDQVVVVIRSTCRKRSIAA